MADTKITALTALTGANTAPTDVFPIVDISDTTIAASGTNKKTTRADLQVYAGGAVTVSTPTLDLSQTWNSGAVTFTGIKQNITNTASAAASKLIDLQVGGVTQFSVNRTGEISAAYCLLSSLVGPTTTSGFQFASNTQFDTYHSGTLVHRLNSTGIRTAFSTVIPAGGTAGTGFMFSSTANFGMFFGSGAPTLSAAKGSLYLRSDGSTTNDRMYVNTDGSTTWTAVTTVA